MMNSILLEQLPNVSKRLLKAPLNDIQQELARRCLIEFATFTNPLYRAEPVHVLIASVLDRVADSDIDRLMIFAPPQHGKSELVSVRLPAFWFGKRPDDPVILTSYGASLAYGKSWQARQCVESTEYQELFDITTDPRSRARDNWRIADHRGELVAAGVGGPITGHGCLLGIIDDPFENWEQAYSQTIRDKIWDWWRSTFRTRIWEGGRIVIIMTRWHQDDLCGRLLQDQGDKWTVLRLPALAETQEERDANDERLGQPTGQPDPLGREPGEPLCPGRFSKGALEEIRHDVGPTAWNAQYQGVPRAPEGNRFKRGWFKIVDALPDDIRTFVRYWDKAGTAGGSGSHTAGVLMGRADGIYYVIDVKRGRWEAGEREAEILQTAHLDRGLYKRVRTWVEQEPGSGGKESAEATIRNLAGFSIRADRVTGSKELRAEPLESQARVGNVRLLEGKWNWDYLEEMTTFPSSRYTDQVDASSGAFNKLSMGQGLFVGPMHDRGKR